jgi:predicted DNA-binding transcriptional regulator YafY
MEEYNPKHTVWIRYKNYRGETADRRIVPKQIRFASTPWHVEEQWLLDAFDIGKQAERSFALKDVLEWRIETNDAGGSGNPGHSA